jgi:hypothetical protein
MGDPSYWKPDYSGGWAGHKKNVETLASKLKQEFPKVSLKYGFGATSEELLEIPQEQKDEPDIYIYHNYNMICSIEVSGSERGKVPPYAIWVRPGKYNYAKNKLPSKTWFYMIYPMTKSIFVLDVDDITPFEKQVEEKFLSTTGYGKKELYIEIPYKNANPESVMWDWIRNELKVVT